MGTTCFICHTPIERGPFCDWCEPDTCYWCPASDVHYDETHVRCSHGCEHTLVEHSTHHYYTVLLNGDPAEQLAYGGQRIEVIIPRGTPITVHETIPNEDDVPDGHVLTTHYTKEKSKVLEDGVKFPPHEHATDRAEWSEGTIREHAVYAWPYTPSYTENELDWSDNPENDYVILSVPESEVSVSSYRFLWALGPTESNGASQDEKSLLQIPYDRYETDLVFSPDVLREASRKYQRPCGLKTLLL